MATITPSMVLPITPAEARAARAAAIPGEVFAAFNELITEEFDGDRAVVSQSKVLARIMARLPDVPRQTIFERGWLDVEDAYRAVGWVVRYDNPGYNESYTATFEFLTSQKGQP